MNLVGKTNQNYRENAAKQNQKTRHSTGLTDSDVAQTGLSDKHMHKYKEDATNQIQKTKNSKLFSDVMSDNKQL